MSPRIIEQYWSSQFVKDLYVHSVETAQKCLSISRSTNFSFVSRKTEARMWISASTTEQIVQTGNCWASNWFCILGSVTPGSLLTAPNTNRQKTKYKYQNAKTNTNFYLSGSFTPWAGPAWVPPDHQTKYQQTRGFPSTHPQIASLPRKIYIALSNLVTRSFSFVRFIFKL